MAVPKSVIKIRTKQGQSTVEFIDHADWVNYTMEELIRAALRDTGKYIVRMTKNKVNKRTGKLLSNIQYWVRKREGNLQVGFKPGGWYGLFQELGTEKQPKIGALTSSVEDNINTIRQIQAQYLSALNDEDKAVRLIEEEEYIGEE